MKIALVSAYDHAHPGGVKSHIDHLKDHCVNMGHQVKIMAPFSYEQPLPKDHPRLKRTDCRRRREWSQHLR